MDDCCSSSYHKKFDHTRAQTELRNYKSEGLREMSRPIFEIIKDLPLKNRSLLDIGGGVGAITFELFEKGIEHSTYVDISKPYTSCFQQEVSARDLKARIKVYNGDFLDIDAKSPIPPVDLVVLDKVICCYPDYAELVDISSSKSKKWYAYCIPHDLWWVKFWHPIRQAYRYLKGSRFKSFIHPCAKIEKSLTEKGFKLIKQSFYKEAFYREWQIMLFERSGK